MSLFNSPFESGKPSLTSKDNTKPTAGNQNADAIEDFLNSDESEIKSDEEEEPPPPKKGKPAKEDSIPDVDDDEDKDEDDEDSEDTLDIKDDEDEDDKPPKKDEDDEVDLEVPPKKAAVLAKYPNFFKDFPAIEKMIFRDKAYAELFGSFDDAKATAERAEQFKEFEETIFSGDISTVLKAVKENDENAYNKIVDNYLDLLQKEDKEAWSHVTSNFTKRIIKGMVAEAKDKDNKDLYTAADILHDFLFNKSLKSWEEPTRRTPVEENPEAKKLAAERQAYLQEKFEDARDNLTQRVDNSLKSTIADHIDPRGRMSAFEKKKAIEDCLNLLHSTIGKDKIFSSNLNKLWKDSFNKKFDKNSLDKIRSTYLGKASRELATVIKKIRAEVLKDKAPAARKEDEETPRDRKPHAGRPSANTPKAKDRQPGESVADYFNRD